MCHSTSINLVGQFSMSLCQQLWFYYEGVFYMVLPNEGIK
jgi:hypothetical protein